MNSLKIVDLFCGAGGFAYGFKIASSIFHVDLAIDINEWAIKTYRKNFPSSKVLRKDIADLHSLEILDILGGNEPDIIIASPPCEAYSIANVNRMKTDYDRLYSDPSGRNLLHAIRIIIDLNPRAFLIENVKQVGNRNMQEYIRREFRNSDYPEIYFNVIEALDYGVPSARKRVFISNLEIPRYRVQMDPPSVADAFQGLTDPFSSHTFMNHSILYPSHQHAKKIPKTKINGALVYFRGGHNKTFRNYIRLDPNSPAPTIMGKSRFIHPWDHRLCTVREHARLMSYPDSFEFIGPQGWQYNHVGESVPPILSKEIAELLFEWIP